MPEEIFEVTRERFHLLDRNQYIVQGSWPKDAKMEAYLDGHKLKTTVNSYAGDTGQSGRIQEAGDLRRYAGQEKSMVFHISRRTEKEKRQAAGLL